MPEPVITVENLGKRYRMRGREPYGVLRETIADALRGALRGSFRKPPSRELWALRAVSFAIQRGQVVGVIGRNGAGKSTLLRLLAQIAKPSEGRAVLRGRVGSLLELGTGFHPELTGRENVYLNGAILGMRKAEIAGKFEEIVAFAELERFIDEPVKHYSSGMSVRLAFAVAAHLEPEILLVDEVLAVGDAAFQKKCLGTMGSVARQGRTVLFVSHDLGAISALCDEAIYLHAGSLTAKGPAPEIVRTYLSDLSDASADGLDACRLPGYGEQVRLAAAALLSADGHHVGVGEPLRFALTVTSAVDLDGLSIGSSVFTQMGMCVGTVFTEHSLAIRAYETLALELTLHDPRLAPGSYYAGFSVGRGGLSRGRQDLDIVIGRPVFQVPPAGPEPGSIIAWSPSWGNVMFGDVELRCRERSS